MSEYNNEFRNISYSPFTGEFAARYRGEYVGHYATLAEAITARNQREQKKELED